MQHVDVIWVRGKDGNVQHLAENDVTPEEVEEVLAEPTRQAVSRSSGRPLVQGYTRTGRRLVIIYEQVDAMTIYPITAYEPKEQP